MIKKEEKIHLGVYGLCVKDNKVLVIKKARGPYTGKFDLPGGRIEFDETFEKALAREIMEETGSSLISSKFLQISESIFDYTDKDSTEKTFHHVGIYYLVDIDTKFLKTDSDGHDSNGAEFIPLSVGREMFAPIAYSVIDKYIKNQ